MAAAFHHHAGSQTRLNRKARRHASTTPATAAVVSIPPCGWLGGSGYARYVGRVGALAVALGLGAAVATGFGVGGVGVAWAEDGDTQSDTHDAPGADNPNPNPPAGGQDESTLNTTAPTGTTNTPSGTTNGSSGPVNPPSVPPMQVDSSGGAHSSGEDDNDADGHKVIPGSGSQATVVTPPQSSTAAPAVTPPAPPTDPAPAAGFNSGVPQTNPGLTAPPAPPKPAPPAPPAGSDPGKDTVTVAVDNPGAARSALLSGGGAPAAVSTFSAFSVDPDPGPQLLVAAAAPGTPAPHPLVDQPDNLIDAVIGAPVVLANIAVTAVSTLLSSVLFPGPGVPAPPVMLFLVLGWVQRELQRTFFNQSPTAVADVVGTSEDTGAYIAVLANDIDPDINTSPSIFPGDVLTVTDYTQPTLGSVVLNPDGTFLYTPDPILQGLDDGDLLVDSFTYTVSDEASPWHIHGLSGLLFGGGHTSTTTVYVAIAGVNDAPVANPDAITVSEDGPAVTYNVVANDTDADLSDTLSVSAVTQGTYGSVTYSGGSVTYTPSPTNPAVQGLDDGETLTDTFDYTVTDGDATDTATVTVTINGANDAPDAVDDTAETTEDASVSGNVIDNDTDIDDEPLSVTTPGTITGAYGTLSLGADGTYTYTPGQQVTITDPAQVSQGTWTDVYGATGDKPYVAFTFTPTNTGTYTIRQLDIPTDTMLFVYDGTFDPTSQNTNLIAFNDDCGCDPEYFAPQVSVDLTAGQTYTIVNTPWDTGDTLDLPLTFISTGPGVLAGTTINPPAQALDDGETLTDTFTYTVTDGDATDTATLTVTINGLNDPPIAVDDVAQTTEDASVSGDVIANDTDIDDEPLSVTTPGTITGAYGTLTLEEDGTYTYTPGQQVTITDPAQVSQGTWNDDIYIPGDKPYVAFTFTPTNTGTYLIEQVNIPRDTTLFIYDGTFDPTSQNTNLIAFNDDSGPGLAPRLTVDLTAGQTYTIVNSTWNTGGTLDLPLTFLSTGPGVLAGTTINPPTQALDDGETLEDTFTYTVTDGEATDTATLTVTINGLNDPPVAVDDVAQTTEDASVSGYVIDNDTDIDDEPLTVTTPGTITGAYGTLSIGADGAYTYTPGQQVTITDPAQVSQGTYDSDFGVDGVKPYVAFTFTPTNTGTYTIRQLNIPRDTMLAVYDGTFDPASENTNLIAFNDDCGCAPQYLAPQVTVNLTAGQTYTIVNIPFGTGGDLDLPLTFISTGPGVLAGTTINPPTQALDNGETLTDTFTYTVTDGDATDTATLTITINGLNDPPIAADDVAQTTEDAAASGNVIANDTDIDDEPLSVTTPGTITGAYGTLSLGSDGTYSYTPGQQVTITDPAQVSQGTYDSDFGIDGVKPYVAFTFTPTNTGTYVIEQVDIPRDTMLFIYDGTFDPASETTNLLAGDDDSGPGLTPRLTVNLTAGQTYTIVNIPFGTGGTLDLPLTFISTGPGVMAGTTINPAAQALDNGETLTDTFTYTVTDGDATDTATLTVTINGLNDAPVAVDDTIPGTVSEDSLTGITYNVVANDTDVDVEPLSVSAVTQGTYGSVTSLGGTVTYTPSPTNTTVQGLDAGDTLTDTFTYTVTDGTATDTATVTVTITGANDAPAPFDTTTVVVGGGPSDVVITPDGTRAYITNLTGNSVMVLNVNPSSPTYHQLIDTNPVAAGVNPISVGISPSMLALTPDGKRLYVSNSGSNSVSVIDIDPTSLTYNKVLDADPSTPGVQNISVGSSPRGVAISNDGTRAYVANSLSASVSVIDINPASPTYHQLIDTDPVAAGTNSIAVPNGPFEVTISPDGTRAYVTNITASSVSVIDINPASPTYHKVIDTDPVAAGINSIPVGSVPQGIAITPDGTRAYVPNINLDTVTVIDVNPSSPNYNKVIDTDPVTAGVQNIPVGDGPVSIAISPGGTRAYVTNAVGDTVSVIDIDPSSPTYNRVIDTNPSTAPVDNIPAGNQPLGIAITPDGTRAYVTNTSDGSITVIYLPSESTHFGNDVEFSDSSSHAPNYLLGSKVTLPTAVTVTGLALIGKSATANVIMALYTDSAGSPGTLVVATSGTPVAVGAQELPVTPTFVPAGDYWIVAVYDSSASIGIDFSDALAVVQYRSQPYGNTLPDPFGSPTTYTGQKFNYYIVAN